MRNLQKRKVKKYKRYIRKQIKKAPQEKNSECKILEEVTSDLLKAIEHTENNINYQKSIEKLSKIIKRKILIKRILFFLLFIFMALTLFFIKQ